MTREWIDERTRQWVMRCDQKGCTTRSETFPTQPDLELFRDRGWYVAKVYGDVCPTCLAKGIVPGGALDRRVSDR